MVDRIPQHRHCENCDKAIQYKDRFCDEKCEQEHKAKMKDKKRQLTFFYIAMVAIFIIAMIMLFLG